MRSRSATNDSPQGSKKLPSRLTLQISHDKPAGLLAGSAPCWHVRSLKIRQESSDSAGLASWDYDNDTLIPAARVSV